MTNIFRLTAGKLKPGAAAAATVTAAGAVKLKAGAAVDGAGADVAGAPAKEIVGGVAKKLGAGFVVVVVGAAGAGAAPPPPKENSEAAGAAVVVGFPKANNDVGAVVAAGAGATGVENNESDGVELAGLEKEKDG